MQALAQHLLPILQRSGVLQPHAPPYVVRACASTTPHAPPQVVGHSMGCWAAYELMRAIRAQQAPLPAHAVLACMPSPTIPPASRPWTPQHTLDDAAFQQECRGWGPDEALFQPQVWSLYRELFRADFALFDRYTHTHEHAPPLAVPATLCWAADDGRVTRAHVLAWKDVLGGPFVVRIFVALCVW